MSCCARNRFCLRQLHSAQRAARAGALGFDSEDRHFVSFTSTGNGCCTTGALAFAEVCCFLPPVSHIIKIISTASPRTATAARASEAARRFRGLYLELARSVFLSPIGFSLRGFQLCRLKVSFLFSGWQVSVVDDLGADVTPFSTWKLMRFGFPSLIS